MNHIEKGTVISNNANCYQGMVVLSVSKNGWIKGYFPSNVKAGFSIEQTTFSVRAHWIYQKNQPYKLIVTQ